MISIIIPFYKKIDVFKIALEYNHKFFSLPDREVVLVLDEPTQEQEILQLLTIWSQISWRVVINRNDHAWRNPAKALNVGIRHVTKEYVFVQSPESVIKTDVPLRLLKKILNRDAFAMGHVKFCLLNQDGTWAEPERNVPYGSLMAPRSLLEKIQGYDETFDGWGGDDDNLRKRLLMAGAERHIDPSSMMYHLERESDSRKLKRASPQNLNKILEEVPIIANNKNWGKDFSEMIFDYKKDKK